MKKIGSKIVACIMMSVLAVSAVGGRVLASSSGSKTKYISEVTVSYAGTYEEAKKELEGNGYKIASETNVNDTLNAPVYLGYKETTEKKDAITDLAVMDMGGKFSYTDYENLMKNQRNAVENQMDKILVSIEAFREKYESGSTLAAKVYDYLNYIYDDVSGENMGDYLLTCDIDPDNHGELTDVFMKANAYLASGIFQALALCADSTDMTLFDRLQDVTYDDIEERYLALYKSSINKAVAAMDVDYGNDAREILSVWDGFYEKMLLIQESGINEETGAYKVAEGEAFLEDSQEILEEAEDASAEEQEIIEDTKEFLDGSSTLQEIESTVVYDKLLNTEYEDGTLLDFFLRPSEEVELEELYPLCEAMTNAQKAMVATTGLEQIFTSAMTTTEEENEEDYSYMDQMLAEMESISIYDGIDLDIYNKGVALTSEATEHQDSSPSAVSQIFSNPFETDGNDYHWVNYVVTIALPSVVLPIAAVGIANVLDNVAHEQVETAKHKMLGLAKNQKLYWTHNDIPSNSKYTEQIKHKFSAIFFNDTPTLQKIGYAIRIVTLIVIVVAIVINVYLLVKNIMTTIDPKAASYDVIPHHMMHAVSNNRGTNYTMYKKATAVDGSTAADLNGYKGQKGWLVLYYTKDEAAGEPLTGDIQIKTGTTTMPVAYDSVHMFGNQNAVNLTDEAYTGVKDKVGGTYMYVKHSPSELAGSTFAGANGVKSVFGLFAGLACGILAGVLYNKGKGRKKQEVGSV